MRTAAGSALRRIQALLIGQLDNLLDDGPVLLAPAAALAMVPWTLLPALRGRPVAVVPSVTVWLSTRGSPLPQRPAVVFGFLDQSHAL